MILWIDCETYSETPINHGTYRYTADCEVMLVAWAVDDGEVWLEDLTAGADLSALLDAYSQADEVYAHNAMFDRNALARILPTTSQSLYRWRCTMVQAMAHSLPGSLDKLSEILGLPADHAKLKTGRDLVNLFCKPRPANQKLRRATRETHPAEWDAFRVYAMRDIDAMRGVHARLPKWNWREQEIALWHLDQQINDRGFAVDLDLAQAAIRATDDEKALLAERAQDLTSGGVQSATQRDAMLAHVLAEYGVQLPDMTASTLERRIADPDLPDALRELLAIRLQATTSSTSKYRALVNGATDGRLRGTAQFCGASRTGRWAHRSFQPGNLPRPTMEWVDIEAGIADLKAGVWGMV